MIKKQRSPIIFDNRYYNYKEEFSDVKWYNKFYSLFREFKYLYHGFKNRKKALISNPTNLYNESDDEGIWWIGHATFIIKIGKIVIITDPVLFSIPLVYRLVHPAINVNQVPHVDYILISHNHWDHMDKNSINLLFLKNRNITLLLPKGDAHKFKNIPIKCLEFDWWQEFKISGVKFIFLPAHHWSQSTLFDRNKSLWGSWLVQSYQSVYFAGDTAYDSHFQEIANIYEVDYALLPIGPCEPREHMCKSHMGPEESLFAYHDLKAKFLIPMHWGTFSFGLDERDTAKIRLINAQAKQKSVNLYLLKIGDNINFSAGNMIKSVTFKQKKSELMHKNPKRSLVKE